MNKNECDLDISHGRFKGKRLNYDIPLDIQIPEVYDSFKEEDKSLIGEAQKQLIQLNEIYTKLMDKVQTYQNEELNIKEINALVTFEFTGEIPPNKEYKIQVELNKPEKYKPTKDDFEDILK